MGRKTSWVKLGEQRIFSLFLRRNSTSSSQCKENRKWTMTPRMVRAACGYTLADDHRIVILPRETFSRAHLPPRRCEIEGISRGDQLKCCLKCAAAYMFWSSGTNSPVDVRAISHRLIGHISLLSFSSSPESGQSVRIKSCLVTTRCVVGHAGDTRKEYRWQDALKVALMNN